MDEVSEMDTNVRHQDVKLVPCQTDQEADHKKISPHRHHHHQKAFEYFLSFFYFDSLQSEDLHFALFCF